MKLSDAASYLKTGLAPKGFTALIKAVKRIFNFAQERSNRLARYLAVTREYKKGVPVDNIVSKYECSKGTVIRYARLAGLPKRPKHFPEEIKKAVMEDYRAGMPVAKIAELHGVSAAYVSRTARQEGVSRYAPRPKKNRNGVPRHGLG